MVAPASTSRLTTASADRPVVLVTGFDPFGGDALNPSWLLAERLHWRRVSGHVVQAAQLPTRFADSLPRLYALLAQWRPALVVCLGLAASRAALSIERVAINVQDARIPDNAGAQPVDEPVVAGAPAAYFSTLPIKAMRRAMLAAGVPAEVSQTAGTFVCNHVFYGLMHHLATRRGLQRTRGGFIHVPPLAEHGPQGLPLEQMVEGLRTGIRAALGTTGDIRQGAGATD
ncbi:MAG TPA: pyroglutamyl-peptidase I [Ottowia sp.]|nr:pyroglutamyl-peptidase I [Ottowia sp.]HNI84530.1 pyroglutamyl-peptidase I [Ottowia sp.]HNJ45922.1 pyroglutamyl-peptidase I [Ottowia sp.]HNK53318.1 pyroglutamyl-peptidase I [Ottowia sp.]HNL42239.1 pyroglutamyl-peptidase I [Ottowia sp.]